MVKNGKVTIPKPVKPVMYDKNPEYHRLLSLESPMIQAEDVKKLQSAFMDGIFGPNTKANVISWQKFYDEKGNVVNALKQVDGIVGSKTWNALFE